MNERIKELAEQAANNFTETFRWEYCQQIDKDIFEKFAELIIEESIIDFYRRYLDTTSNEDITVQVERYIKENFGDE